jgi:hypothetical protein
MAVYGEVHRGLLVAAEGDDEARSAASKTLLAATVGLLTTLPAGGVELFLATRPLSPLYALSTAPALVGEPFNPDNIDQVRTLLDQALDDERPEGVRPLRVVVLDHALAVLANSPALGAQLETAVVQGPGRRLVVLASTVVSHGLSNGTLTAFACRVLLGPCVVDSSELVGILPTDAALLSPPRGQALWADRRAGAVWPCVPWVMDAAGATQALGLPPALLELPGGVTDAPRPGRTLLVLRLLGTLVATAPDGRRLAANDGLRQRHLELLAFLATHWAQPVSVEDVPPELQKVAHHTREAISRALGSEGGLGSVDMVAENQDGTLGLGTEAVWVDSVAFAALCHAADTAPSDGDRLALLERAIVLYSGDFLGQASPPWAEAERTRLRALYLNALRVAMEVSATQGCHDQAILYGRRLRDAVYECREDRDSCLCPGSI